MLAATVFLLLLTTALPGAEPLPDDLQSRLERALADRGASYVPRTRHHRADGSPKYTNRLILEASPYLLQHAHNPVNWYPWGAEALARATSEDKPILLSIGYSTCHWCHVMEHESFEDEEIAALLNRKYVAIKVDREQRPDIDAIYMEAVQRMTGSGGWPTTVWLTPDGKPFYGGTYFPARDGERAGRVGFLTLLDKLSAAYAEKRPQVTAAAADVAARLQASAEKSTGAVDTTAARRRAVAGLRSSFDGEHGGFGAAPKFPRTSVVELLLRHARREGDAEARAMAEKTLAAMYAGGIFDHVGGGFHRYSTDARWLVPHFEKMLYDNALLVAAYLEGYQASGREELAEVVRRTLAYVEREMTAPGGAFYSASDADSEGVEGKFYVWTQAEIAAVLGPERAAWFSALYGVTPAGNFDGSNVLHRARPPADVAAAYGLEPEALTSAVAAAQGDLYAARRRRPAPLVDRKIVVSWNGLMISAFARAGFVLGEPAYLAHARAAADFLRQHAFAGDRPRRSWFEGRATGIGFLDDYAFTVQAYLDLFEASGDVAWLDRAVALQRAQDAHFWDEAGGGYFLTPDDGEKLIARSKPDYDGAEPSGNSVSVLNLARLAELTGDESDRRRASAALAALAASLERMPGSVPKLLVAGDFLAAGTKEIAVVLPAGGDGAELLAVVRRTFVPNRVLVVAEEGAPLAAVASRVPWLRDKRARGGKPTAYVCESYVCDLPTSDPAVLARQLEGGARPAATKGRVDLAPTPTHSAPTRSSTE